MNIAIILLNFSFNGIDGIGNYAYRTVKNLASDESVQKLTVFIEVENLKFIENFEWIQYKNIEIKTFKLPKNKYLRAIRKLFILPNGLLKEKFDTVIYVAPPVNILALTFLNVTTVVHDITPLIIDRGQSVLFKLYYYLMIWLIVTFSKKIVCVSEATKNDLIRYFHLDKSNIVVSYNNIPNAKLSISNNIQKYLLVVSTIQPGKNIENVIRAFAIFSKKYNLDFRLVIVGKHGWGAKDIYDLPKSLKIDNLVEFKGYVEVKELEKLYTEAWALVNLSLYEGFGLPILEAMYYNCPSIVSNVSALPEVAGNSGVLVNPNDLDEISEAFKKITEKAYRLELCSYIPEQLFKFDPKTNTRILLE